MVGTDLGGIDTSSLEDVSGAASSAAGDISSVGDSASGIDLSLQSIGEAASHAGSGIGGIAEKMGAAKGETSEATNAAMGLAEGFSLVEGVVGALVGIGLAAWVDSIANAAGNFQDSWIRLSIATGGSAQDAEVMKTKWNGAINSMRETTGRRAGAIREFITQMGISGVTSSDVIIKSFNAIAGADFMLNGGKNIEGIAAAFENVIRQPTRVVGALRSMGITTDDILKSTGLTTKELTEKFKGMSVEQRAVFLSNIVSAKYGQEANEGYKMSWEHVKEALGAAWDYISRILGSLILPLIVPVLEFLTDLLGTVAGAIDSLNPTIKSISGVILLFGTGLASLAGLWSGFVALLGGSVPASFGAIATAVTGAELSVGGLLAAIGPLGWAILAIIGTVIAAIYVWQNWSDEIIKLKDNIFSGNWAGAAMQIGGSFQYIGQAIWNALVSAGQMIWNFFAGLPAMIGNLASWYVDMGSKIVQWIVTGLTSLSSMLTTILDQLLTSMADQGGSSGESAGKSVGEKTGNSLVDGFINWVNTKGPTMINTFVTIFMKLLPLLAQVVFLVMQIVGIYLFTQGRAAAMKLGTGLLGYVRTLPARLLALMIQAALTVLRLGSLAYSYARSAASRIISGISGTLASLPSRMYSWGRNAFNSFINAIINSIPGLRQALNAVKHLFPHSPPKTGPLSEITASNMYNWMKGIAQAGIAGFSTFDIGNIELPMGTAIDIAGGNRSSTTTQTTLQVQIKKGAVQIQGNATPETIETAGENLGKGIARGAVSNGINTRIDLS